MIISANDHKDYHHIQLPNGLDVLLISDLKADKSSAALAVNVGHYDDPHSHQGLSHLLEHMMFLGTEQFPDPNEYHEFIRHHGGSHNAWTSSEHTNYFFAINNDFFAPALIRFSDFFINPLLDGKWIKKEIEAVESEYQLKLKDENRRTLAVLKECANQQHPFSKFSVGNKQTLSGTDNELESLVRQFYLDQYCASKMKLVLLSNQPIDALIEVAKQYFNPIENRGLTTHYPDIPLYTPSQQNVDIRVVPDKDIKKLTLSFSMPKEKLHYRSKPLAYIAYLLGHEGDGSLLSLLKKKGLANTLSAGIGLSGYNYQEFSISLSITDKGLREQDSIIGLIFNQINLIKTQGIDAWRYTEKHNIIKAAFEFQESSRAIDTTSHLVINMFNYDVNDIVFGDYAMESFEPNIINQCLSLMTVDTVRIISVSLNYKTDKLARWYHTPFHCQSICSERKKSWLSTIDDGSLTLPPPNPFVVERLVYTPPARPQTLPRALINENGMRLWHLAESQFKIPKGHIYTAIDSPVVGENARSAALCRLYVEMIHDSLAEMTYPAEIAGMHYDIYPHQAGVTMHLSGYTPKLFLFFEMLISKIRQRDFSSARFDEIKYQLHKSWLNSNKAKPINILFKGLSTTLQPKQYDYQSLANELSTITLTELGNYISELFEQVHLESFVQGDWEESEVKLFGDSIHRQISALAKPCPQQPRNIISIANQATLYRLFDNQHNDSAIIVYYQGIQGNPQQVAMYSLLNQLVSPRFFAEIRTKQQLGYLCGSSYIPLNRHPGMMFYIQSPVCGTMQLLDAIDNVILDFENYIESMSDKQWQQALIGLKNQVKTPDTTQHAAAQRYWVSIGNQDHQFNHRQLILEQLEQVTKKQLLEFLKETLLNRAVDRLVLSSQGLSHHQQPTAFNGSLLDDIAAFTSSAQMIALRN
ncbi:insulinase family protein [Psychrobium sp. 1_MG-2023]|uniref:insulinase family protein n=1 Tax=Psychrobium sp. 1_MG-2023 TaxID=3062624 RepID=UPI000C31CD39|nr:insulinase family protein [Psychrobium sp. 1_MG-2023]MDP2560182.1 insulinase family protein [Psychrobium sp. 1_MG-2023]PKF56993.1 peptidase M16 [Alteromonadales bacterium alter-6D02]